MTKIFAVFFVCAIILCGCAKQEKTVSKLIDISFVADISYYDENFSFKTHIDKKGEMTAQVISPEDFKNLKFIINSDSESAEFMGLTYTPKTGNLPVNNVARIMFEVINDVGDNTTITSKSGENHKIKGKIDAGEYIFTFSPSGLPLKLQISDIEYIVRFSDLTLV